MPRVSALGWAMAWARCQYCSEAIRFKPSRKRPLRLRLVVRARRSATFRSAGDIDMDTVLVVRIGPCRSILGIIAAYDSASAGSPLNAGSPQPRLATPRPANRIHTQLDPSRGFSTGNLAWFQLRVVV